MGCCRVVRSTIIGRHKSGVYHFLKNKSSDRLQNTIPVNKGLKTNANVRKIEK